MSGDPDPKAASFWNELYWFAAIGLIGWIVAAIVLPPRIAETAQFLEQERSVLSDLRALEEQESVLEGAVTAMENDPFYQAGVIRSRLKLKKADEEYLEDPPPSGR